MRFAFEFESECRMRMNKRFFLDCFDGKINRLCKLVLKLELK